MEEINEIISAVTAKDAHELCREVMSITDTMDVLRAKWNVEILTAILRSYDTYQFNDYSRYDAAQIDAAHKAAVHETQFPKDLENAYELGRELPFQSTKQPLSKKEYKCPIGKMQIPFLAPPPYEY